MQVCQRYIAQPALYGGRKFDLRILVAVRSFHPLQAYTWGEPFVRAANRRYDPTPAALGDFQTQFTSMRQGGFEEAAVSFAQLSAHFEAAGRGAQWQAAQAATRTMLRSLLAAAAGPVTAAAGGGCLPRCRALYGIDVMYDSSLAPQLLEVTFMPGVERPMAADGGFLNQVFGCLFLGETAGFRAL